ncbi:MAG TPA: MotA/TolQ/ExbB proton channel family protein [Methylomirabilota bacterium]|nr:MotA/TolQ/ExbB proton channel family protein [Methylomirabilota bacterium]
MLTSADNLTAGVLDLIWSAGPVAKLILAILGIFSIISWALIVEKWWQLRRVRSQTLKFLQVFREGRRAAAVAGAAKKFRDSPLAQLYVAAFQELSTTPEIFEHGIDEVDDSGGDRLAAADRAMRRQAGMEVAQLERYLPFLATTASSCPFIGLFGTVWGVMSAFHGIGAQGSASLAVVAPGISEALIATAAGLGAAIPAVIGYNYFVNRVKHWATEMDGFTLDLLNMLSRPAPKLSRPAKDGI